MFDEQRQTREGLGTAVARVLLELGVGLKVGSEVGAVGECAATLRAGEGAFTGVRAQVSLQQPRP